jgi:hypothetical protein
VKFHLIGQYVDQSDLIQIDASETQTLSLFFLTKKELGVFHLPFRGYSKNGHGSSSLKWIIGHFETKTRHDVASGLEKGLVFLPVFCSPGVWLSLCFESYFEIYKEFVFVFAGHDLKRLDTTRIVFLRVMEHSRIRVSRDKVVKFDFLQQKPMDSNELRS